MKRVYLAFVVAVLAVPACILLSGTHDALDAALHVGVITAVGVLGIGLPVFYIFRCKGWWQLSRYLAAGGLGGMLYSLSLFNIGAANFPLFMILFTGGGAVHAALFWFIAAWRNPRLTEPSEYCFGGSTYKAARNALALAGAVPPPARKPSSCDSV